MPKVLYVRIPDDLKDELDKLADRGKHVYPPQSLAVVTTHVLRAGLAALAEQEAKPRKVRRG
jgi:predicted transcriptional regulator